MGISVRGVARRFKGKTGAFSVRQVFLGGGTTSSLRSTLRAVARQEISFSMSECVFGWTASWQQTWSDVVMRIRLNPDAGISGQTMATLQNTWESTIQSRWSDQWALGHATEISLPIRFDVQWVTSGEHHAVRVINGTGRANMGTWYTASSGAVAAHEFGHMIGNVDEYPEPAICPNRSPVNTGTIMDNNSNLIPARLLDRVAASVQSTVVGLPT